MAGSGGVEPARRGRPRLTTRGEITHVALTLFIERGFDSVTVDDIAASCGIGRSTFFRYFPSKNDLPWGEFELLLQELRRGLAAIPLSVDLVDALRSAIISFNAVPAEEIPYHRDRMRLLLGTPSLVAHSTLRYESWRQVIADFVADRLKLDPRSAPALTMGWVCLGISLAAYELWLDQEDSSLAQLMEQGFESARELLWRSGRE